MCSRGSSSEQPPVVVRVAVSSSMKPHAFVCRFCNLSHVSASQLTSHRAKAHSLFCLSFVSALHTLSAAMSAAGGNDPPWRKGGFGSRRGDGSYRGCRRAPLHARTLLSRPNQSHVYSLCTCRNTCRNSCLNESLVYANVCCQVVPHLRQEELLEEGHVCKSTLHATA